MKVYNENFFDDLHNVYMEWELIGDGKIIKQGKEESLHVTPGDTTVIDLNYSVPQSAYKEVFLNIYYKNKEAQGLLPADWEIAKDQLTLYSHWNNELKPTEADNLHTHLDNNFITVNNKNVQFNFSRADGLLHEYSIDGNNLIKEGYSLKPNFWRAPTDNDFGAGLQKILINWKRSSYNYTLLGFSIDSSNRKNIKLSMQYSLPDVYAMLNIKYELTGNGEIKVTESMIADSTRKVPMLFKFGMQMMMPKDFDQMEWYGRGPSENYQDRKDAAFMGLYKMDVHDQFHPYLRPQETGNKTDVRWVRLTNEKGTGVLITGDTVLNIAARHFLDEYLDDGLEKHNSHFGELKERDITVLNIDLQQTGVGGINSWGTWPLEKYRMNYQNYSYSFLIKPVK
jgi:beta-galactosidase